VEAHLEPLPIKLLFRPSVARCKPYANGGVFTELALGGREFRDLGIWECTIMEVKIRKKNQLTSIL
jgi:hypothetical protein